MICTFLDHTFEQLLDPLELFGCSNPRETRFAAFARFWDDIYSRALRLMSSAAKKTMLTRETRFSAFEHRLLTNLLMSVIDG